MLLLRTPFLTPLLPVLMMFLHGCGTMHHFVPPTPPALQPGHVQVTAGLTWSPHEIYPWTVQASGYFALGTNDFLGLGVCNFIVPNNISYIHYQKIGDASWLNYQLHCNHLLTDSFDPAWEADLGIGSAAGAFQQGGKLGLAYFGEAPFPLVGTYFEAHSGLTPAAGYDAWYQSVGASAEIYPGMTDHFLRAWRGFAWPWGHDDADTIGNFVGYPEAIPMFDSLMVLDDIRSEQPTRFGWRFTRADGTVVALEQPVHPGYLIEWGSPAIATSTLLRTFTERQGPPVWALYTLDSTRLHPLSSDTSYTFTARGERIERSRAWGSPRYFRMDGEKAVAEYRATGRLVLRDDPAAYDRAIAGTRWGLDDITVGIGFRRDYNYR